MKHMLFLARDEVSYRKAEEMFPDIKVELYPDIVTSLIGTKHYSQNRNGILMCCRDDLEKFYTDKEILNLMERLKGIGKVSMTDTTKHVDRLEIVRNAEKYIWKEIEEYSPSIYHDVRRKLISRALNLPGSAGRFIIRRGYSIASKVVGFN